MQTEYRVLYRYVNPTTNTAITNEADYEPTEEFFHPNHKANVTGKYLDDLQKNEYNLLYLADNIGQEEYLAIIHNEGDVERETIITENMANENKSNNLYVYNGTKKTFHKNFIPDQLGYVVRDWTRVPKNQIPSGPDDFTKHFVMLGGSQLGIDQAYLVCKPQYAKTYMRARDDDGKKCFVNFSINDAANKGYSKNATFYGQTVYVKDIEDLINQITFFKWYDTNTINDIPIYGEITPTSLVPDRCFQTNPDTGDKWLILNIVTHGVSRDGTRYTNTTKYNYIFWKNMQENYDVLPTSFYTVDSSGNSSGSSHSVYTGWRVDDLNDKGYPSGTYGPCLTINGDNIIKEIIPAHYELSGSNPYIIRDTYKKINLSPWILHSIHKSFESGLDSAKTLVGMVGINNVKLIKYVPTDQFIKVK